jgi:hypothetical protein
MVEATYDRDNCSAALLLFLVDTTRYSAAVTASWACWLLAHNFHRRFPEPCWWPYSADLFGSIGNSFQRSFFVDSDGQLHRLDGHAQLHAPVEAARIASLAC